MSNINTIFVSAFITKLNKRSDRNINDYIFYGKKLINNKYNNSIQILFIEKEIFNEYLNEYNNLETIHLLEYCIVDSVKIFEYIIHDNIIFVFFEKEDIYLYNYQDKITNFNINTDNNDKDTLDYMFVQCHKTEWVKIAIELIKQQQKNLINLNHDLEFLWVDFGIYHMINNDDIFYEGIGNLVKRIDLNKHMEIRIPGCWDTNINYYIDVYRNITWYFAGSIFGGPANKLIEFSNLMKEKCLQVIHDKNTLMWEVNVWYLIFLEHPELFDIYYGGHDTSIIINY